MFGIFFYLIIVKLFFIIYLCVFFFRLKFFRVGSVFELFVFLEFGFTFCICLAFSKGFSKKFKRYRLKFVVLDVLVFVF